MKNRTLRAPRRLGRSFSRSITGLVAGASLPVLGLAAGCGQGDVQAQDPLAAGDTFVAINRDDVSSQTLGLRRQALGAMAAPDISEAGAGQDFYLAINRKELSGKFFLSSYLKQAFPGAVSYGAGRSLGTRVVSFKIQNGKLFMFDVGDGKKTSDTFDPELVIEAYPIVQGYAPFDRLPGSKNYVLIDPSAGRNRFSVVTDAYNSPTYGRFSIELSFLQRFRKIADGVTFEQVFAGYSEGPDANSGALGEPNQFRSSGTLGLGLRRYTEGEDFAQYQPGETDPSYFFVDDPLIVPNTGTTEQYANKWNVVIDPVTKKLVSKPIEWVISDHIDSVKADPRFKDLDLEGALKKAITNWNTVFGAEVLKARKATPGESFADDDKNYVLFDEDPTYGAAFANWRSNPNTGEIRGASVYFSSLWLEVADQLFEDDMALRKPIAPRQRPTTPMIVWDAMKPQETCTLWALPYRLKDGAQERIPGTGGDKNLTKKAKSEQYLTHVLLHEIGHTLGLRHNFKGSLKYQGEGKTNSSSVMEYIDDFDAVFSSMPGTYDADAIKLLYGLSDKAPTDPFCTDEDTELDPNCATFDRRANPLPEFYGPNYAQVADDFLNSRSATSPNTTLNNVAQYVRAGGSAAVRMDAWNRLVTGVKAPLTAMQLATPGYGARADFLARRIIGRLYIDAANLRGNFTNDPPAGDTALSTAIVAELRGNLLNVDNVRTFTTRRLVVDVLKKLQTSAAYSVLKEARDALAMSIPTMTGDTKAQSEDLLARIDKAIQPYFNN